MVAAIVRQRRGGTRAATGRGTEDGSDTKLKIEIRILGFRCGYVPTFALSTGQYKFVYNTYYNMVQAPYTDSNIPPQSKLVHTRFRFFLNRSNICRVASLVNTSAS